VVEDDPGDLYPDRSRGSYSSAGGARRVIRLLAGLLCPQWRLAEAGVGRSGGD